MEQKKRLKRFITYFTKGEMLLWCVSVLMIVIPFCIYDKKSFLTLIASIMGVTAIIFNAKGNPFGQFLIIVFCIVYGLISYQMRYYGETITYVGMSLPMAIISLVTWLKNPFKGKKMEVEVNVPTKKDYLLLAILSIVVTIAFYFILKIFGTANLTVSTISISTSFIAAFLTYKRSELFALGYMLNDIVLIVLWTMALSVDIKYVSVVSCFVAFLLVDSYSFINWSRIKKRQQRIKAKNSEKI